MVYASAERAYSTILIVCGHRMRDMLYRHYLFLQNPAHIYAGLVDQYPCPSAWGWQGRVLSLSSPINFVTSDSFAKCCSKYLNI